MLYIRQLKKELLPVEPVEVDYYISKLVEYYFGWGVADCLSEGTRTIFLSEERNIDKAIERVKKHEPIQYILGHTFFLDSIFIITSDVFIPRRETEEWVNWIINNIKIEDGDRIIDIGTGSGVIAITLKNRFKGAKVFATDSSPQALEIARKNEFSEKRITWRIANFLHDPFEEGPWNLIVSNPPYIPLSEKPSLAIKVSSFEPSMALFVHDEKLLFFYEKLARFGIEKLSPKGKLICEINENQGDDIKTLFEQEGLQDVKIFKDMQNKPRWIVASQKK